MPTVVRSQADQQVQIFSGALTGVGPQGPAGTVDDTFFNATGSSAVALSTAMSTLDFPNIVVNENQCLNMTGPVQFSVVNTGCHNISASARITGNSGTIVVLELCRFTGVATDVTLAQSHATIIDTSPVYLTVSFSLDAQSGTGTPGQGVDPDVFKVKVRASNTSASVTNREIWFVRTAAGPQGIPGTSADAGQFETQGMLVWSPDPGSTDTEPANDPDNPFDQGQMWFNPAITPRRSEFVQFVYPTGIINITGTAAYGPYLPWGLQRYTTPCQGIVEIDLTGIAQYPDTTTDLLTKPVITDTGDGSIRITATPFESRCARVSGSYQGFRSWQTVVTEDSVQLLVQPQFWVSSGKVVQIQQVKMALKFMPYVSALHSITVT